MNKKIYLIVILILVLSGCSKNQKDVDNPNAKTYYKDDIYLYSYGCGYIDVDFTHLIIENNEQLDYARERCGLDLGVISGPFNEMAEKYPLEDYTYVVVYDNVSSTGYHLEAGGLCIGDEEMYFEMTEDSYTPQSKGLDIVGCMMGGFCHMAAVPKSYLPAKRYQHWIYPDRNDMYQDIYYYAQCELEVMKGKSLINVYGDTQYLIRSEEEFNRFLEMSSHIKRNGEAVLYEGWFRNPSLNYCNIDFEEAALLVKFFPGEGSGYRYIEKRVRIDGNKIILNTEIQDECLAEGNTKHSCMFLAHIPLKYLTEENYDGWITP